MDITTQNFDSELARIKQAIKGCDFIAMDTEFTGLNFGENSKRTNIDNSNVLYKKHKYVCEKYQAIQVGLCIFTWDEGSNSYLSHPYNFYVLPTTQLEGENRPMLFDPDTCQFLQKYEFNWDLLFKYGVSYKTKQSKDEIKLKCQRVFKSGYQSNRTGSFMSESSQIRLKEHMRRIQNFWFNKEESEFKLTEPSKLVRKHLHKLIFKQINTSDWLDIVTDEDDASTLIITKNDCFSHEQFWFIDSEDSDEGTAPCNLQNHKSYEEAKILHEKVKNMQNEELKQKEQALFRKEYGFTEIIDKITKYKKPLIGHNCFFDMVYFYRQFIGLLPDTFKEFKHKWVMEFPFTFDTKYISCKVAKFPNSALNTVYKSWIEGPKYKDMVNIKFHDDFDRYKKETKCHEAGYDAHMTGWVFAILCKSQEIQTEYFNEKGKLEGIDLDNENTDDEGDEKLFKDIVKSKKCSRIDTKYLETCNLKIVKNLTGGSYFYLGNQEPQDDDSVNIEDKINEITWGKENFIFIELLKQDQSQAVEEIIKHIGDIYIEESTSRGYLVEVKDLNLEKYSDIDQLISSLTENPEFQASVMTYKEYVQKLDSEQNEA